MFTYAPTKQFYRHNFEIAVQKVLSYIRDDLDFFQHIHKQIDKNSLLVSFDVISLYTNIPHDLGLRRLNTG